MGSLIANVIGVVLSAITYVLLLLVNEKLADPISLWMSLIPLGITLLLTVGFDILAAID